MQSDGAPDSPEPANSPAAAPVNLTAQPLASASPTSDELAAIKKTNLFLKFVIVKDEAGTWRFNRIKTTVDKLQDNKTTWWLEPAPLEDDANISPEIAEIQSILANTSTADILNYNSAANARIETLIDVYATQNKRRTLVQEVFNTENSFVNSTREFVAMVAKLPKQENINIFMEQYQTLAATDFLGAAAAVNPQANNLDEFVLLKAQALIDAFVSEQADGTLVMTQAFADRLKVITDSVIMYENFSKVFGEGSGNNISHDDQITLQKFAIMPTQRVTRYDLLSQEIVRELGKIQPQTPELQALKDKTLAKFQSIAKFTLQANEIKRKVESLQNLLATQAVLGKIAHEGLVSLNSVIPLGDTQIKIWQDFLTKLATIAEEIVKKNSYFSGAQDDKKIQATDKFYETFMDTFVEAYLLNKDQPAENLSSIMLQYIKSIDKKLQTEGLPGIIFNKLSFGFVPTAAKVFATIKTADEAVTARIVNKMFDSIKTMIESETSGADNEIAYNNAFVALKEMGPTAIAIWNQLAAEKFNELSLPNPVEYKKIITLPKTEPERVGQLLRTLKTLAEAYQPLRLRLNNLEPVNTPKEQRENIIASVIQLYQDNYLDGRYREYLISKKLPDLQDYEALLVKIENTLTQQGQRGLFNGALDTKGVYRRELVIFPALASLRQDQVKRIIDNLYNRAKSVATKINPGEADALVYVNAFKEMDRTKSDLVRQLWMDNVAKERDASIVERMSLSENEKRGIFSEDASAKRFKKFHNQSSAVDLSPVVEEEASPLSSDSEEEISRGRASTVINRESIIGDVSAPVEPVNEFSPMLVNNAELFKLTNLDILGKIADELKTKRVVAARYGFTQLQIWDTFAKNIQEVSKKIVESAKLINPEEFYEPFMRTFINGYIVHEKSQKDVFSEAVRSFMVTVDKYFHQMGTKGVVYATPEDLPGSTHKDLPVLQSLNHKKEFQQQTIEELFNQLKFMVEGSAHGDYEKRVFNRTIEAVSTMGQQAIMLWNLQADKEFFELSIPCNIEYPDLLQLGRSEVERRETLLGLIKIEFAELERANGNLSAKESIPETLMNNITRQLHEALHKSNSRSELNEYIKLAMLKLFSQVWVSGQVEGLKLVEQFIQRVETRLANNKQKGIFVEKPENLKPYSFFGTYTIADTIFAEPEKLTVPNFNVFMKTFYDDVKSMMGNREAEKIFAKAIMLLEKAGLDAKKTWNEIAKQDPDSIAWRISLPDIRIKWTDKKALILAEAKFQGNNLDAGKKLQKLMKDEFKVLGATPEAAGPKSFFFHSAPVAPASPIQAVVKLDEPVKPPQQPPAAPPLPAKKPMVAQPAKPLIPPPLPIKLPPKKPEVAAPPPLPAFKPRKQTQEVVKAPPLPTTAPSIVKPAKPQLPANPPAKAGGKPDKLFTSKEQPIVSPPPPLPPRNKKP